MSIKACIGPEDLSDPRLKQLAGMTGWSLDASLGFLCRLWVETMNSKIAVVSPAVLRALVLELGSRCAAPPSTGLDEALLRSGYVRAVKGGLEILGNAAAISKSEKRAEAGRRGAHATATRKAAPAATPALELSATAVVPKAVKKPKAPSEFQEANRATWEAYAQAYAGKYGVDPVRNARANGMIANFVKRVGRTESPSVMRFYVEHPDRAYNQRMHDLSMAVRDAEILLTQCQLKTPVTRQDVDAASGESDLRRQLMRLGADA